MSKILFNYLIEIKFTLIFGFIFFFLQKNVASYIRSHGVYHQTAAHIKAGCDMSQSSPHHNHSDGRNSRACTLVRSKN